MPRDDRRCDPSPLVQWVGWHLAEIAGVAVPLVLAVTVTVWLVLVSALVGVAWAAHEVRVARRRRALTAGPTRPGVTAPDAGAAPTTTSDNTKDAEASA